jgi:arabinoxylan arabinofuranohydrolase
MNRMTLVRMQLQAAALLLLSSVQASNPIVSNVGMADPHIHFFNETFYLYATHDFAPNNTGFLMYNWWVWSSADLVSWTMETILEPKDTPASPGEYSECWATDGAQKNGSFYFYISMGPTEIGVVRSTSTPVGPWENVIGTPLVNASVGTELGTQSRDPCAFQDDDGSYYLIFGT